MTYPTLKHPSLDPYDISDYKGLRGQNFYEKDKALQRVVERYSEKFAPDHKKAMIDHIKGYGELVGGILDELTEKSHKEGKYGELVKYDRTGKRIDQIIYSPEQTLSRKISYDYGVVNLDFHTNWKFGFPYIHRYALTYLMNLNGEGGVACPLAMTDGMINALKQIGTDKQKEKYLALTAGEQSDSHFMAGQYVTERVGGSNVLANRTIAKKLDNGKWLLNGEKWFCSNPGDLWVTTAKIEGTNTIGMFLVPRIKENGELNGHHILRKKDIIGSRGKLTVEIIYEDVEAEEFGRPGHGIVNLIKYIIKISRIHVGFGACGNARRGVMEAIEYAKWRTAYGKKVNQFSSYARTLAEMQILQTAMTFVNFRSVDLVEKEDTASEVLIPLLKYKSSSQASWVTQKAILCLGGNGIVGDFSPLPRLHNDSIINETWEGTHLIVTDHCLHALQKSKVFTAFSNLIEVLRKDAKGKSELKYANDILEGKFQEIKEILEKETKDWREINRVYIADLTYGVIALAEFLEQAAFDLKKGSKSIYTDFANGYAELFLNGVDSPRKRDGVFLNPESLEAIVQY
ncbi:acyl-CoA dehydrogenase family protein [Leptospira ilyithenensis]|uniref:Acyl-CoA dehydrogenase n=1 Tax=Leptospira ilyithenensis TaxID=2484901 RepID=A0A4R9LIU9_9LEPT|nr:acyl-CoA dehydrogenase family protein [Leptospira ilyithenensis]TGN06576.1 acyl-CoA dehydrogenase [Leptospira ilyithenensis]